MLYVVQRLYRSPFFQHFLCELRHLSLAALLQKIEEMREWCSITIEDLCDLPESEIDSGYNWNCYIWLTPIVHCFRFFHPAEDLINGLSGVKLIGHGPGHSAYRIHRDVLQKSALFMDWESNEQRFAFMYPLFQVIMLAKNLPENVAFFVQRQATAVYFHCSQILNF